MLSGVEEVYEQDFSQDGHSWLEWVAVLTSLSITAGKVMLSADIIRAKPRLVSNHIFVSCYKIRQIT